MAEEYNPLLKRKENTREENEALKPQEGILTRSLNWFQRLTVRPYFKTRDLNNFEGACDNKPRPAAEVGIKITF